MNNTFHLGYMEKYKNPLHTSSFDYFIRPIIECKSPPRLNITVRYADVVYEPPNDKLRVGLFQEIYFIDDDLLDPKALIALPFPYALRILTRSIPKFKLRALTPKQLWVSTTYLAKKYSDINPIVLRPIASKILLIKAKKHTALDPRICYHGTWSHKNEIKWLIPVIREVQSRCPDTIFEIIGGDKVAKLFKGIPRVEVLDTMPWPQYLEHTSNVHQDIGLAPLMDTLFNRGRGPIKFFDYARAGAVGIYSKGPAFGDFVTDGVDGFLLDNDPQLWVEKIVELVNNPELRQVMADKAWEKVLDNSPASQSVQDYLNGFQT